MCVLQRRNPGGQNALGLDVDPDDPRKKDKELTANGRALLTAHMYTDYYYKATVEALADNYDASAAAAAWAGVGSIAAVPASVPVPAEAAWADLSAATSADPAAIRCSKACGVLGTPPLSEALATAVTCGVVPHDVALYVALGLVVGFSAGLCVRLVRGHRLGNRAHTLADTEAMATKDQGYDLNLNEAAKAGSATPTASDGTMNDHLTQVPAYPPT